MQMYIHFSLGGENLAVAQNNYAVLWFKGKELNMVFGLLLSVSRIVSHSSLFSLSLYLCAFVCVSLHVCVGCGLGGGGGLSGRLCVCVLIVCMCTFAGKHCEYER